MCFYYFFEASNFCFFYISVPLSVAICPCDRKRLIHLNLRFAMPGFPLQSGLETSVAFPLKILLPIKNLVKVEFQNKFWLKPLEFFFLLEGLKPALINVYNANYLSFDARFGRAL